MPSTYSQILDAQRQHAKAFGQMLRRWREFNGWTQYTAEQWSQEAGFLTLGHGTMSELENGKLTNPGIKTFAFLHEVNRRIAAEDFSGVTSRRLRDLVMDSRPILDEFGDPWTIEHWWAVHKGIHPIPDWLDENGAPELTDAQAAELCAHWIDGLRELVRAGVATVGQMSQAHLAAPPDQQDRFHEVLLGFKSYTPQELSRLWDPGAEEWRPVQWIKQWAQSLTPAPLGGGQVGLPT